MKSPLMNLLHDARVWEPAAGHGWMMRCCVIGKPCGEELGVLVIRPLFLLPTTRKGGERSFNQQE
jgi:hypothetical protein